MPRNLFWKYAKLVLAAAVVVGVGLHFGRLLTNPALQLRALAVRWDLLALSGLLYLGTHCVWGSFWVFLLWDQGIRVTWRDGVRAYFVSQFGKYVPGKVWVIVIRTEMLRGMGAKRLPVVATSLYETLTSMGAGAALGVLLLPVLGVIPPQYRGYEPFLVLVACLPLGAGILHRVSAPWLARRRGADAPAVPGPAVWLLAVGALQAAAGWCLLAVSLGLAVEAVTPPPYPWATVAFPADLATVALSYVMGFVFLFAPAGVGAREVALQVLLAVRFEPALGPDVAGGQAVVVALLLRLVWTAAEMAVMVPLWWWGPRPAAGEVKA
jgi:hypothetical protein